MRPIELSIEGFRSFAERAVFDWRGRRLIGIVGPIGSGKSSILDAIVFALYARTPVFGHQNKALIQQGAAQARVELAFEVDGAAWTVLRMIRRRGASRHALYRAALGDPGTLALEADKERQVNARIVKILGLDFAAFTRSVMLAQNRFAQFLEATPSQRDDVLKGVFGLDRLDRMHAVAKDRRAEAALAVEHLSGRLATLADDRQRLDAAAEALAAATARATLLEAQQATIGELEEEARVASGERREAEERLAMLATLAAQLPDPAAVEAASEAVERSAEADARAEEAAAAAREAVALAELKRQAAIAEVGSSEDHARAERELSALTEARETLERRARRRTALDEQRSVRRDELAAARDRLATLTAEEAEAGLEDAAGGVPVADGDSDPRAVLRRSQSLAADREAAMKAAVEDLGRAEDTAHRARHAEMAATLGQALRAGVPCPVCQQPVAALPLPAATPDLDTAEEALGAARDRRAAAEAAHLEASTALAEARRDADHAVVLAQQRCEAAEAALAAVDEALAAAADEEKTSLAAVDAAAAKLVELLGKGDPAHLLASARRLLGGAVERLATARRDERVAADEAAAARGAAADAAGTAGRLVRRLSGLAGQLGAAETSAEDASPRRLAAELGERLEASRERASVRRDAALANLSGTDRRRRVVLRELDLSPADDFAAALTAARTTRDKDGATVAELERRLARADALADELGAAEGRLNLAQQLVDDLARSGFLRYLLDEERTALAALGSERFELLTGGRYRFTDDGSFGVVDLAQAEAERKAETLSGGETFLASLALALALAAKVQGGGGRLDAFFLDEGFGSLDPEHLDLALEGVERLVADSPRRLVTVVSHVPALRERVEDLIVLDKDPLTGHTIVRSGAVRSPRAPVEETVG